MGDNSNFEGHPLHRRTLCCPLTPSLGKERRECKHQELQVLPILFLASNERLTDCYADEDKDHLKGNNYTFKANIFNNAQR